jgi:hypothetical protein
MYAALEPYDSVVIEFFGSDARRLGEVRVAARTLPSADWFDLPVGTRECARAEAADAFELRLKSIPISRPILLGLLTPGYKHAI